MKRDTSEALLDTSTVIAYLASRGLRTSSGSSAVRLSGGVSNVVIRVSTIDGPDVVVKQALGRLAVADEWRADRNRSQTEAVALTALSQIVPGRVPEVIDTDPDNFALIIQAAPPEWETWKEPLLRGDVDPVIALTVGEVLGRIHADTRKVIPSSIDGALAFRQLRLDPYFSVTALRHPDLSETILHEANRLESVHSALVLGDFSPKNLLVGSDRDSLWIIDLEVAHIGDSLFDVAFMVAHLVLKGLHVPGSSASIRESIAAFLAGYEAESGSVNLARLRPLLGCLLLARVSGSSPVEYLSETEQARVVSLSYELLTAPPTKEFEIEAIRW